LGILAGEAPGSGNRRLRGLNIHSPHQDRHPWLNRREKELMRCGKATVAEGLRNDTRRLLHARSGEGRPGMRSNQSLKPYERVVLARAGRGPVVETVSVKRGGASYHVPTPIRPNRRDARAVRWLVDGAILRLKKDRLHGTPEALALEVLHVLTDREALKDLDAGRLGPGGLHIASHGIQKRLALHKVAKANRVFTHRRWR